MTEKTLILYSHPPRHGKTVAKKMRQQMKKEDMNLFEEFLHGNIEYPQYYAHVVDMGRLEYYRKLLMKCGDYDE